MQQDHRISLYRLVLVILLLVAAVPSATGQAQTVGQWSTLPYTMPINPVHAALLHTGNVLIVSGSGNDATNHNLTAALWNRQAGTITIQTVPFDMFCNGMVILPDGRPFVLGGTEAYDPFFGLPNTATYDPATGLFTNQQSMAHGRWYPTGTVLGNGSVMVYSGAISGEDSPDQSLAGTTNTTVEIYTVGSGWSQEYAGSWTPPLYPRMHLLPNGTVFYSAPTPNSAVFDPSSHTWQVDVATTVLGSNRGYGTSVLLPLTPANNYDPRVMILGGGNPATRTTEIIDLGASNPAWQNSALMSEARTEMNAVILPSGHVLALGGSVNDEEAASASLQADLFDPVQQTFSPAGSEVYARLYHSVAMLLPDATVWVAGSNPTRGTYEQHMEIYQPPYLFQSNGTLATRPTITSAPSAIDYATAFQVQTPDAANISSVVMMRNPSVTHAFDMDQRMVGLSFTAGSGSLTVTGPPTSNIAPPGFYMLFLLNSQGVPSVASMVQIPSGIPPPPPPGIVYVQGNSTTQSSASSVAIAFQSAQTTGNLNLVQVMWGDTVSAISSVTDSKGNVYSLAAGPSTAAGLTSALYYAKNIAAGTNTVTVKFNRTASFPNVNVLEYSGLDTANPLDVTSSATGTGTTANSGSATTTSANELVVGAGNPSSVFTAAGSGFSSRIINAYGGISEDRIVSSTGSYSATATLQSGTWVMQMAAFRASGQSSGGNPAPTVSAISPPSGTASGGTAVTITGTGFLAGATVKLGGTAATGVVVGSSTSITATTPAHAAGAVDVVVTNSDAQSGTLSGGFTYTASNPAPTVSAISPPSGTASGGTAVTITGTGFLAGATVKLGGTAATGVVVGSSTSITATTPAHAAGAVDVVVTNSDAQSGTLSGGFTYTASNPAPTVSAISPPSGTASGGTAVTITGTGFLAGATVKLGGTAATGVVVGSSTSITATTPAHAAGAVDVVVTNSDAQSGTLSGGFTYTASNPAPTVSAISPPSGTASGGTAVTITGTGFLAGATVKLGGTAATGVVVGSSTSITATTPAHAAGAVDVVVTNSNGQSGTLTGGYTYNATIAGTIAYVQTKSAVTASASSIAIAYPGAQTASNLNLVQVMWGDTVSAISSVTDSKGNVYSLAAGPSTAAGLTSALYYAKNIAAGTNTVTVKFNRTASFPNVNVLEYSGLDTANPLDVTSSATGTGTTANSGSATTTSANELVVGAGNPSSVFTAAGSGFSSRIINAYGGISEDRIVSSTGSYSATATLQSGTWVMQMAAFRASGQSSGGNPAPTVSAISPPSGTASGGTAVTITGTGFLAGATVKLGGTAATGVVVGSSTSITATTPAHAAGAADVVVTNSDAQSGTLSGGFTYTASNPAPTVSAISPPSGTASGGTAVTITGTGFLAGATVKLGGTAATGVVVGSSTSITATTPAHAAGAADVVVTNSDAQSGTLSGGFTYTASNPAPTVSAISPPSGTASGGTAVTITGTGFLAGATVKLGGTAATGVVVGSSTSITATTPAHAAGAVDVVVTNSDAQSGTLSGGFTYTASNPAPTVSAISPPSGTASGGTAVTITGTGFLAGATVKLGGTAATGVVVGSSTSITATTPAHAAGAVDVVVTNSDAQSGTLSGGFTYTASNPAPTVSAISPPSGTASGGTAVTITGTGFLAGATVKLGGTAATGVVVGSSTSITATTPAHAAGAADVVVTNSNGQSGTLSGGFSYNATISGPISFVQANSAPTTLQSSNSSLVAAYSAVQTAGNLNIAVIAWGDTTTTITGVSDTTGNTYTLAVGPTTGAGLRESIYYAKNIAGGSGNRVTVTFSKAAAYPNLEIFEYSGLDNANPLDVTAAATGSGTAANSSSATTTSTNELIFGAGNSGGNLNPGPGYTKRGNNVFGNLAEDKIVSSTGSYSATGTQASSTWLIQMAAFRGSQ